MGCLENSMDQIHWTGYFLFKARSHWSAKTSTYVEVEGRRRRFSSPKDQISNIASQVIPI